MDIRILLVDDETSIVDGLEIILQEQDPRYKVVGKAYNGLEGFDRAIELRPDIIISDIRMPRCDGLDMIRYLKKYDIGAEYILLSGYAEFEYAKKAMEYGVKHYITKPIDPDELFEAIEKLSEELGRRKRLEGWPDYISDEYLQKLEEAMDTMNDEALKEAVHRIFEVLRENRDTLSLENIKQISLNLVVYGTRKFPFAKLRINAYLGTNVFVLKSVSKLDSLIQLESWVYNMLRGANEILLNDNLSDRQDVIRDAKEYIRENFSSNISLNDIADHFYINPFYFSQCFKKKTGITYQKYVTDLRIRKAEKLLSDTDMKVYEISEAVGYTDTNYFSKLFERSIGMKPSVYRTEHKKERA